MCWFWVSTLPLVSQFFAVLRWFPILYSGHQILYWFCTSVVYDRLIIYARMLSFLDSTDSSLGSSYSNWVYHQKPKKMHQQSKDKEEFVYSVDKKVLGDRYGSYGMGESHFAILVTEAHFWAKAFDFFLACKAISSQCTNPVKLLKLVVESFRIVLGSGCSNVSTFFVTECKSETG